MTSEIMSEIQQLQKKALKYDDLISRSREFAQKLNEASRLLKEVADELDPTAGEPRQRSGINYPELADELYLKMQAGSEIGTDLIQNMYPDWAYNNVQMLLAHIKKRPNVESRRDGHKIFYFCLKELR